MKAGAVLRVAPFVLRQTRDATSSRPPRRAQPVLSLEAPEAISSVGGGFPIEDNGTTPHTMTATYRAPSFTCHYEYRMGSAQALHKKGYGISFHGTKGMLFVDRDGFKVVPREGSDLVAMEDAGANALLAKEHRAPWTL